MQAKNKADILVSTRRQNSWESEPSRISEVSAQNAFRMTAVVPIPCGAFLVESRKRPLEESAELIEVKREKSEMEGKKITSFCTFFWYRL